MARDRSAARYLLEAAFLHDLTCAEILDRVWDRLAWITRYSKGAVQLRDIVPRLTSEVLVSYQRALDRLVARENGKGDKGGDAPELDEGDADEDG